MDRHFLFKGNTYQNERSLLMYWFAKANSELKY